jgi:hypothetical protein
MNNLTDPLKPKRIEALTRGFYDELLVYDAGKHRAHCLNKTAAAVWLECSGDATVPEIATKVESLFHTGGDDALVRLAILKLRKAGLLEETAAVLDGEELWGRRDVLKRIRTAAIVALPLITTMLVPTPARAASCFPVLHHCSSNAQCCSGICGLSSVCL